MPHFWPKSVARMCRNYVRECCYRATPDPVLPKVCTQCDTVRLDESNKHKFVQTNFSCDGHGMVRPIKMEIKRLKWTQFSIAESYLSTGQDMTIEYLPNQLGTNRLYGPTFKLRYEFLDTALGGAPIEHYPTTRDHKSMPEPAALLQYHSKSCNRVYRYFMLSLLKLVLNVIWLHFYLPNFRSSAAARGIFRSPSNVFMFGRGGSSNISCTIRFEGSIDETVR